MAKLVVTIVMGLLFLQTTAPDPIKPDTSKSFVEPATGTVFPPYLGNWKRGADRNYGPGGGVSIAYQSLNGVTATIYIYNLGLDAIPDGTTSPTVKSAFAQTKREMGDFWKETGAKGQLLADGEIKFKDTPSALHGLQIRFLVTYKDGFQETSAAILTGYQNQFLKVRLTYPKDDRTKREAEIKTLLGDLNDLLKK